MTIKIEIYGDNAANVLAQLRELTGGTGLPVGSVVTAPVAALMPEVVEAKAEPEKKTRKAKEEKIETPKQEILEPEKVKYTLQNAIDRAREVAGDGKDEGVMIRLKSINTKLGIAKVREIPVDKLDTYMSEINKEFPQIAPAAETNMFD